MRLPAAAIWMGLGLRGPRRGDSKLLRRMVRRAGEFTVADLVRVAREHGWMMAGLRFVPRVKRGVR